MSKDINLCSDLVDRHVHEDYEDVDALTREEVLDLLLEKHRNLTEE